MSLTDFVSASVIRTFSPSNEQPFCGENSFYWDSDNAELRCRGFLVIKALCPILP